MKVISYILWALVYQAVAALAADEDTTRCTGFCCDKEDDTPCNTGSGNKCLKQSYCKYGKCKAGPVKQCNPPTQCKYAVGGCNPATGFCTFKKKPDYTDCDDGKDETEHDWCIDGFCVGHNHDDYYY